MGMNETNKNSQEVDEIAILLKDALSASLVKVGEETNYSMFFQDLVFNLARTFSHFDRDIKRCVENGHHLSDALEVLLKKSEDDARIAKKAMELLPAELDLYDAEHPVDIEVEMKSCRELCNSVADAVRDAWKNEVTDVNEIRLKMTLIGWILDTNNFGDDPYSNNFYSENLLTLSHAMARERVRQMEYDEFSRLRQEAAE